jgi:hypothetical protein
VKLTHPNDGLGGGSQLTWLGATLLLGFIVLYTTACIWFVVTRPDFDPNAACASHGRVAKVYLQRDMDPDSALCKDGFYAR